MRMLRNISLLLFPLLLLCACNKDLPVVSDPEVTDVLPFSITVRPEADSRASFDGAAFGSGSYVFAEGDKLYITGGGGNVSGELTLVSGAGTGIATFSGSLSVTGGYLPTAETELNATLVGSQQGSGFFTISDGRIATGPNYPSSIACATLADLVQKYSHFTASFHFGIRQITLTQQTVFLDYFIELYSSALTGSPATVRMDIKSSGGSTLFSVTDVPVGGSATVARMSFIAIFPASADLQGAQTWIDNGSGIHCEPDFANDLALSANKYYNVSRSAIDVFTVEAPSSGTGASVTFNYTPVQYRRYSDGVWSDWSDYSSPIALSPGEKVSFRGQRTYYTNTGGNTPLISVDNNVYIYGDIMSLICDANWVQQSSVVENAFKQAFKGRTNIDIHPDEDLRLSATNLGASCYESMFQGCTSLTKSPVLPATTSAASCYKSMFEGCTSLTTPPSTLPVTTVENSALCRMFYGCTNLLSAPSFSNSLWIVKESGCSEMFSGCANMITPPPSLPADTLGYKAYFKMFYSCSNLKSIPEFPHEPGETYKLAAGTSAENGSQDGLCYQMFYHCDSLTTLEGKQLFNSSTQLQLGCFNDMFSTCVNLTTVPSTFLPATTLAPSCYRGMFQQCAKLTRSPDLEADTLASECYRYMFNNCQKLTYIRCLATTNLGNGYTTNWVGNTVPNNNTCTFVKAPTATTWPRNAHGILSNWKVTTD